MAQIPAKIEAIIPKADTILILGTGEDKKYLSISSRVLSVSKVLSALLSRCAPPKRGAPNSAQSFRITLENDDPHAMTLVILFLHGSKADGPVSMELLGEVLSLIRKYELVARMGYYLEYIRLKQHSLETANSCSAWFNNMLLVDSSDYPQSFQTMSRLLVLHHDGSFGKLIDIGLIHTMRKKEQLLRDSFKIALTLEEARSIVRQNLLDNLHETTMDQIRAAASIINKKEVSNPNLKLFHLLNGVGVQLQKLSAEGVGGLSLNAILTRVYELELYCSTGDSKASDMFNTSLSRIFIPIFDELLSGVRGACLECHKAHKPMSVWGCEHDTANEMEYQNENNLEEDVENNLEDGAENEFEDDAENDMDEDYAENEPEDEAEDDMEYNTEGEEESYTEE